MGTNFTIQVDPERSLVHITMTGLLGPDDVDAFLRARATAHARLTCPPNAHVTLNDLSGLKIQPQEVVAAFRNVLGSPGPYRSRRLAFVAPPTLTRAQLMRAVQNRDARCFDTAAEAKYWLFAADHAASSAA